MHMHSLFDAIKVPARSEYLREKHQREQRLSEIQTTELIELVLQKHCRQNKIRMEDLISPCRSKHLVIVRKLCGRELYSLGINYTRIGEAMNRDRTTVAYWIEGE